MLLSVRHTFSMLFGLSPLSRHAAMSARQSVRLMAGTGLAPSTGRIQSIRFT